MSAHTHRDGTLTFTNNTFSGNSAYDGGGVHATAYKSTHILTNNSFYANQATHRGGGIYIRLDDEDSTGKIYNNVLRMNTAPEGGDLGIDNDGENDFLGSPVELFNNDFDQSTVGTHIQIPFNIDPSNLDNVDPLFEDPIAGDYHLSASSPCIDKGSNNARSLPETDKDGNIRIINAIVDIGAYEYNSSVPSAPSVYTDSVTNKTSISATLNGRVNPNGLNTETYFEYGTTASYGSVTLSEVMEAGTSFISKHSLIENLSSETRYHYRIVATNSAGESFGVDRTFWTTIVYVSLDGTCYSNNPCFAVVQEAIDIAPSGATFKIQEGPYYEHILADQAKEIILEPGCDSTFTICSGRSGLSALTLRDGTTIINTGCLEIGSGIPSNQHTWYGKTYLSD